MIKKGAWLGYIIAFVIAVGIGVFYLNATGQKHQPGGFIGAGITIFVLVAGPIIDSMIKKK